MSDILLTNAILWLHFSVEDIGKNIKNLNSNIAHELDNIRIHMLKILVGSIFTP